MSGHHTQDELHTQIQYRLIEKLAESEARYRQLVENLREIVFEVDEHGCLTLLNQAWQDTLGYDPKTSLGQPLNQFLYSDKADGAYTLDEILKGNHQVPREMQFMTRDATVVWLEIAARPTPSGGASGTLSDVTERKQAIDQLHFNAYHDKLTGSYNRTALLERLQALIDINEKSSHGLFAILLLDLDNFKQVNDSLGHLAGDQLLVSFTQRIQACLRATDMLARLGGDEFTLVLLNVSSINPVLSVLDKIWQTLQHPFNVNGHELYVTISVGVVLSTVDNNTPESFLRDADIALYKAKQKGKNTYEVFDTAMRTEVFARLQLETDLRRGLLEQQFELHYQPIVSAKTHQIVGLEALVRWRHPKRGLVFPSDFITVAEETGLISQLGWWVLRQACQHLYQWQQKFQAARELYLSVNIASQQFLHYQFLEIIKEILNETALAPHCLTLEITEGTLIETSEMTIAKLNRLKQTGIHISIDDFGTGYSSLSYLHRLPIDNLKIDRSFIQRLGIEDKDTAIVKAIMALADNLNIKVVAEGIEKQTQCEQLEEIGCTQFQGYLFSRPMPPQYIETLFLASQSSLILQQSN